MGVYLEFKRSWRFGVRKLSKQREMFEDDFDGAMSEGSGKPWESRKGKEMEFP